jgi:hypothetical protein
VQSENIVGTINTQEKSCRGFGCITQATDVRPLLPVKYGACVR